jgi:3-oxoacyl-[acyl-carrier protein] reductase
MKITGKVAIVTGAGRGIGKAIAKKFASEGCTVVLASRSIKEIDYTLKEIINSGGKGLAIKTDISNENDVRNLVKKTLDKFSKIDILVNNAAVITPIGPIQKIDSKDWEKTIRINLFGTFLCIREVVPYMITRRSGKIINLSGGGAFKPFPNFSAYSVSKAGIVRLTETIAEELKEYKIQVNAIAPGAIKTKIISDVLENKELAGAEYEKAKKVFDDGGADLLKVEELSTFLASNESDGLTGRTLSAQWDDLEYIRKNISEIQSSDKFTMKRMV